MAKSGVNGAKTKAKREGEYVRVETVPEHTYKPKVSAPTPIASSGSVRCPGDSSQLPGFGMDAVLSTHDGYV